MPPPPTIEKKKIFWRKIVIFLHERPQKCTRLPPHGAIFLDAPYPLTKNSGTAPGNYAVSRQTIEATGLKQQCTVITGANVVASSVNNGTQ